MPGPAPTLALIGCGTIAEVHHLPALARHPEVRSKLVLVDTDAARAEAVAARFGVDAWSDDHRAVLDRVDGAIVTVPHQVRPGIAGAFLERGVPVLSEKPLAGTLAEAEAMVALARRTGAALCVNQTRRLFPAYAAIRELLQSGELGRPRSIRYADGGPFGWTSASGFYFRRGTATGVLLDKGVHGLDAVCWWLGGTPRVLTSRNDAFGGVEGVVALELELDGCAIHVRLSRFNRLANAFRIDCERGTIEGGVEEWGRVHVAPAPGRRRTLRLRAPERNYHDFARRLIDNFLAVVGAGAPPLVPGHDVLPALAVIESAYASATPFPTPWYDPWRSAREAH